MTRETPERMVKVATSPSDLNSAVMRKIRPIERWRKGRQSVEPAPSRTPRREQRERQMAVTAMPQLHMQKRRPRSLQWTWTQMAQQMPCRSLL